MVGATVGPAGHLGGAGAFALVAAMWIYFASGLPSAQTLLAYQPPLPTNVRGYDGIPFRPSLANAGSTCLTTNIRRFLSTPSFRLRTRISSTITASTTPALSSAVFNYTTHFGRGGRVAGGSTITQQVAKYLLKDSSYNVGRKAREAILAFRLEDTLSKQQILELYLNSIFLGRNAYGVQAAARAYFDKDVDELTLPEAAYLAILPKAPSNYDPVRATQKRSTAATMFCGRCIATATSREDQWHSAAATPLGTIRYGSNEKFRQQGGYFMEEVRRELIKQFGEDFEGRTEQPLQRRALGPQLDGPHAAGRRCAIASRRSREVRRWKRLEGPWA